MKHTIPAALLLFAACQTPPDVEVSAIVKAALGVADAFLREKGAAEFTRSVPQIVPLLDVDPKDGVITLDEVRGFLLSAAADPQSVAMVVTTLMMLREKGRPDY